MLSKYDSNNNKNAITTDIGCKIPCHEFSVRSVSVIYIPLYKAIVYKASGFDCLLNQNCTKHWSWIKYFVLPKLLLKISEYLGSCEISKVIKLMKFLCPLFSQRSFKKEISAYFEKKKQRRWWGLFGASLLTSMFLIGIQVIRNEFNSPNLAILDSDWTPNTDTHTHIRNIILWAAIDDMSSHTDKSIRRCLYCEEWLIVQTEV